MIYTYPWFWKYAVGDAPAFAPYLTPERWHAGATAAWTGLTLAHDREDLMRAALYGVATLLIGMSVLLIYADIVNPVKFTG